MTDTDANLAAAGRKRRDRRPHYRQPRNRTELDAALVNAVEAILRRRAAAQLARDYLVADALRDELRAEYNVAVHDREGRWRLLEPTKRRLV